MPNYIARDLGGIGGSGVYPDSRPQINVGDTISAVAGAFNQTKQGVLQRAMLQAQNARAQRESDIQSATAGQQGILPTDVAHKYIADYNSKNAPPETQNSPSVLVPPAAPTQTTGTPSPVPPPVSSDLAGAPQSIGRIQSIPSGPIQSPTSTGQAPTGAAPGPVSAPSTPTTPPAQGGQGQDWRNYFAKPSKLSVIDLPNGYSVIPELNPQYQQRMISEGRIAEMYAGRGLTADAHLQGIGMQQTGAETRTTENNTAKDRQIAEKGSLTLQQIAARGAVQHGLAHYREGLKVDPANMSPTQKAGVYQKVAEMFVGGAQGDPTLALEHAKSSPGVLKEFGISADELNGFIGSAAYKVQAKKDAGDVQGAEHLLSSFAATTPEQAAGVVKAVHHAVTPPTQTLAPLSARDIQMAKSNPSFAAHLAGEGYKAGKDY